MPDVPAAANADAGPVPWWGRLAPYGRHGPLPVLLIAATLLTGVVDAVGYIALGHVFVANMTGNVVLLAFALAGAPGLSVGASVAALAAFVAGAAFDGALGRRIRRHRGAVLRTATAIETGLLGLAFVAALGAPEPIHSPRRILVIVALAFAMGIQSAAARRIAVPVVATTVITATLAGLAADVAAARSSGAAASRRAGAVLAMFGGALAGGLLTVHASAAAGLALATATALAIAVGAQAIARSSAPWARA